MRTFRLVVPALFLVALGACGGNPYGHARVYTPLDDETRAAEDARPWDPVMVQRRPEEWQKGKVVVVGVVTGRRVTPGGWADMSVSVRRLEARNLCENARSEESCRVTVTDAEFGVAHLHLQLRGPDDAGEHSVGPGSLLRVVGVLQPEGDADGGPIVRGTYYRHWPRFFFVTRASAEHMRQ